MENTTLNNKRNNTESVFDVYTYVESIGQGSFGEVFLAKHIKTGEQVAIKQIVFPKKPLSVYLRSITREVYIMRKLT